MYLFKKEIES